MTIPKARHCRIEQLVEVAYQHGRAKASAGRWWAARIDDSCVDVGHFSTRMLRVNVEKRSYEALDPGYGSMTDKIGIGNIVRYEKLAKSYAEVFAEEKGE